MMLRKIVEPYLFFKREAIQNQCIAYSGKETKYNMICNTACTLELSDFGTINGFEHVNLFFFFLYLCHLQQALYCKLAGMLAHIVQIMWLKHHSAYLNACLYM